VPDALRVAAVQTSGQRSRHCDAATTAYETLHVVLDVGYHAYGQGVTLIRAVLRPDDTVLLLYCLTVSPSTPHQSSDVPYAGGAVGGGASLILG
jgi:hypothetical protein